MTPRRWSWPIGILSAMIGIATAAIVICAALACAPEVVDADSRAPGGDRPLQPNVLLDGGQMLLPNGWKITPAGQATKLPGDMPMRILLAPGGEQVLINTGGYNEHGISVLDAASGKLLQHAPVPRTFIGMCFDPKGQRVYLSGGQTINEKDHKQGPAIRSFRFERGRLAEDSPISIQGLDWRTRFIGGLACAADGSIYAANLNHDCVYRLRPADGEVIATGEVGYRPCALALSPDEKTLAVANWGGASISLLDPQTMKQRARVAVGSHPSDLAWHADGRLFVTNAGTNTVSVIDGAFDAPKVTEVIRTSLDPKAPIGSTPIALAVSGDRLYVANADNNDVAVIDIHERGDSRIAGFIPTGWYPSALAASPDGKRLYIGTARGMTFGPNAKDKQYIATMLTGHVSLVDAPDEKRLHEYTRQVIQNTPVGRRDEELSAAERRVLDGSFSKIKYVLYIIKENRTYDQVFGDMPEGNGDPTLTMFGQRVTPNQHRMARQWVLLDNLYCNGDASKDGHLWCDGAYASDYSQKAWLNSYSKRGQPDADDRLTRSPGGYVWDSAMARGLTFRTYGEREQFVASPETAPQVRDDRMRSEWISADWSKALKENERDYEKADIFIRDLKRAESTGEPWPRLITMALPENHTHGMYPGAHTPEACVGSNDLALGKVIEAVTHSKFWPQTAIFVIEDDAQNGFDHVDAHRTAGLVISPYTRRGAVDSTMYTTASYLRTIELILKLPPLSQYDAAATPMYNSFTDRADLRPYDAVPVTIDLAARNPQEGPGAKESAELDFSDVDLADADKFNAILWEHFKPGTPMPAPVRSMVIVR